MFTILMDGGSRSSRSQSSWEAVRFGCRVQLGGEAGVEVRFGG